MIETYEVGSWKGLALYELDPATLAMRDLPTASATGLIGGAADLGP